MEGDFSQRMGFVPMKPDIQLEDIDDNLRTALWNVVLRYYLYPYKPKAGTRYRSVNGSNRQRFARDFYAFFLKRAVDELPVEWEKFVEILRKQFLHNLPWHRVYSFIEFVIGQEIKESRGRLVSEFNSTLERAGSGYRVVGGFVMAITSRDELGAIEDAMTKAALFRGIGEHLSAAVRMLSDKQNPDYRNSIKESISAVESLAKQLTGNPNTTLGPALRELERHHQLHPALKSAFSSLYGWTSKGDGIRHALMDASNLTHADARFMLITCSAFINFAVDSTKE